ncbi:carboxypeptidase-like regulatory domain-containing protein [Granulicella arctica]|uniref:carboxypeptidase-like regulatory domain-containing protein n=1 Tax=Granulicella arctica TaxID=940613 RepID=UPI0021E05FB0|nr:carboxypeptidase-like regulatory domain-containing protein [Granulicella arctica]
MGRVAWLLVVGCGLTWSMGAQQGRVARPPVVATGAVTGRVYCVDTNLPARLASVTLQTIDVKPEAAAGVREEPQVAMRTYQTSLDGSFVIPKVRPGTYYVVIQMAGYLSPISAFTRAELSQPTPETLARMLKAVPNVTVEASHTANLEVRLERGAAIAGTVRYDDGTPVISTYVTALAKETTDKKEEWVSRHEGSSTDDQGRYRITGLPPGEYREQVSLSLTDMYVSTVIDGSRSSSSSTRYSLDFYSGDTTQKSKAKSVKITDGEQRDGADMTIPVSKLHSVSGSITDAGGHVVNAGKLALNYDDGTQLVSTTVDKEDGMFHFDFVPEGTYSLVVSEAKDVAREEIMNPPGTFPPSNFKETTVKEYGGQKQPLVVESDVAGVVMTVAAKGKP